MMKWLKANAAALAVVYGQAMLAIVILRYGPTGQVPMHFGWDGQVDRWGSRGEAAGVVAAMALLSLVTIIGLGHLARGREDRNLEVGATIILVVTSLVTVLLASLGLGLIGAGQASGAATMAVVCAAFAVAGGYLGKVGPNRIVGVRTPWSMASPLAWDKSNRLAGRLFFWGGLVGLAAAPFAPQPAGLHATVAGTTVAAAAAVFESWRVWRSDPERA